MAEVPMLGREHARFLLREMVRIRRFEERCAELYSATKIRGFLHLYNGEEAIAVGVMQALSPDDALVTTYREHGHALARGVPAGSVMAELFGKREGVSHGRGGSMHLFDARRRLYGGNAIVGAGLPVAVGLALAQQMRGEAALTACFFGEGAVAEGAFHESMNLATLWHLPVLFCCENNRYAMGTALDRSESETDIAVKARSYGLTASAVDGMDVLAVEAAAHEAVAQIRAGSGPVLLEFRTYRFRAHSMYDPQLYRERGEVEEWREYGPLRTFTNAMRERGLLDEADVAQIEEEVAEELDAAVAEAEAGTLEPVEDLERFVYMESVP